MSRKQRAAARRTAPVMYPTFRMWSHNMPQILQDYLQERGAVSIGGHGVAVKTTGETLLSRLTQEAEALGPDAKLAVFVITWTFPKIGVLEEIGLDYLMTSSTSRVLWDGRHSTLCDTGQQENAEIEMTGSAGTHEVFTHVDSIEEIWTWKHPVLRTSV